MTWFTIHTLLTLLTIWKLFILFQLLYTAETVTLMPITFNWNNPKDTTLEVYSGTFELVLWDLLCYRVAELWQPLVGGKNGHKIFLKRVFTIFASFLRVTANLQILLSKTCNIYHVMVHFLPKKHCFLPKNAIFCPKISKKVRKWRHILILDKIAYVWA